MRLARLSALGLLAACAADPEPPATCHGICVNERVAHCVVPAEATCDSSIECPSGTSCTTVFQGTACDPPGIGSLRVCRPPRTGSFQRRALERGFAVPRLELALSGEPLGTSAEWVAPDDAALVACALFSCEPEFVPVGPTLAEDEQRFEIENFDLCVENLGVVRAEQGSIAIPDDLPRVTDGDRIDSCEPATSSRLTQPTHALFGCWVYDDIQVIAASRLHEVLPIASLFAPLSCDGEPRWAPCFDTELRQFGSCWEGACLRRCVMASDCDEPFTAPSPLDAGVSGADAADAGPGDGGPEGDASPPDAGPATCAWRCERRDDSPLGVCLPAS